MGLVTVADEVREEAKRTVERLHDLGVERGVMLSGDNEVTGQVGGETAGVDDVRAELLPGEKASGRPRRGVRGLMMVSDEVNDAPALATATVEITLDAAGTATAAESPDVVLVGDELSKLPYVYALSGKANGVIQENIW